MGYVNLPTSHQASSWNSTSSALSLSVTCTAKSFRILPVIKPVTIAKNTHRMMATNCLHHLKNEIYDRMDERINKKTIQL